MLQQIADFAPDATTRDRALRWLSFIESHIEGWPFGGENHLKPHWCRALMLALKIAREEGLGEADQEALCMAAAFHDTRRRNAWPDRGHGARAAGYYRSFCQERGLRYDPRVVQVMAWHDCDDVDGLAAIELWEREHPEAAEPGRIPTTDLYLIFKDADGLDRVRLPIEGFDTGFLRRESSKHLVPFARELFRASQGPGCSEAEEGGPARPYLVVVDVQGDFVDGALGTPEAQAAFPAMVRKAREFDGQVVFTKDTHDDRYAQTQEGAKLSVPHCLVGTPGWELAGEMADIQQAGNQPVYLKGTFGSVDLARDLEAAHARGNVASVEFIGLCTDICVISNALLVKAVLPQVPVSVDATCCAGTTPQAHEAALAALRSCQVEVRGL